MGIALIFIGAANPACEPATRIAGRTDGKVEISGDPGPCMQWPKEANQENAGMGSTLRIWMLREQRGENASICDHAPESISDQGKKNIPCQRVMNVS